jgi:Mn2+/Fe2+ NRAMP family transporter
MLKVPQFSPNLFPSLSLPNFILLLLIIILIVVGRQTIVKTSFTGEDFAQKIRKNYHFILGFHFWALI